MSWSLCQFRCDATDMQQATRSTARADARFIGLREIGRRTVGIFAPSGPLVRGRAVEQQQLAHARGLVPPGRVPQPEVSNLVQTLRQDVLQEPAHEFVPRNTTDPPLVRSALLMADRDRLIMETNDAGVGDGDAKDVSGEVIQDAPLALAPRRALGHPVDGGQNPRKYGDGQKPGTELAVNRS
jgi:hypothetical protein